MKKQPKTSVLQEIEKKTGVKITGELKNLKPSVEGTSPLPTSVIPSLKEPLAEPLLRPVSTPKDLEEKWEQDPAWIKKQHDTCKLIADDLNASGLFDITMGIDPEMIYETFKRLHIGLITWQFDPRAGKEIKEVVDTKSEGKV